MKICFVFRLMANPGRRPTCCQQLLENDRQVMIDAVNVLITYAGNILGSPNDPKFRTLLVANVDVQQYLLPAYGGIECLFEMGFVESDDHFLLPPAASLSKVKNIYDALVAIQQEYSGRTIARDDGGETLAGFLSGAGLFREVNSSISTIDFYGRLKSGIEQVAIYMKPGLIDKARSYMPLEQLTEKAKESCAQLNQGDVFVQDHLLIHLLHWFKNSFFQWMNSPPCSVCGAGTKLIGSVTPLAEEVAHLAGKVESYRCEAGCIQLTRFPRYNDPGRLLETRVGRCGEWANSFTLLCVAAGLEARYVVDWGDHVWTEVYSAAQRRWIHADPCENVCDEPLLYESGWGKKISYVIAYSTDDVQDVTWRYTANAADVLTRRTACHEAWLAKTIVELRKNIWQERLKSNTMTTARLRVLEERTAVELVELMMERKPGGTNLPGRTSGSESWRRARGELGTKAAVASYVIVPTETEVNSRVLELRYSCVNDEYLRVSDNESVTRCWNSLINEAVTVFRKEEHDWKMVYLARQEGTEFGKVVWKFDLGSRNMCVDRVEINVESTCYENGRVHWTLSDAGSHCVDVSPGHRQLLTCFLEVLSCDFQLS